MAAEQSGFLNGTPHDPVETGPALEPLPASGSGITRLFLCREGGRTRVYKVLAEEFQDDPLYKTLLRKDFEIGFSLMHPHICEYYAFRELPGLGNAIEMEYVEGRTLSERLAEGSLSRGERKKVLAEVCNALGYMHGKQVFHRDLKPENILLTDKGCNVKLIDFGCSDSDSHYSCKGAAGTRSYAAPELAEGHPVDARADIWSLGVILNSFFPEYRSVARICTRRNPSKRYGSAGDVLKAIRRKDAARSAARWGLVLIALAAVAVAAALLGTARDADADALFLSTGRQIEEFMKGL